MSVRTTRLFRQEQDAIAISKFAMEHVMDDIIKYLDADHEYVRRIEMSNEDLSSQMLRYMEKTKRSFQHLEYELCMLYYELSEQKEPKRRKFNEVIDLTDD